MRRPIAPLLCLLLAGCSTLVPGQAKPADHDGPVPVPKSALRSVLLDGHDLNTVMGASDLEIQKTRTELFDDDDDWDRSCLAIWYPIQRSVYSDSGFSALRAQTVRGGDVNGPDDHLVVEAAVVYLSRKAVADFFHRLTDDWTSCGDRHFTNHDPDGDPAEWEFGAVDTTDSTLVVNQTQLHTNGWSCQHAMRATNNVIIDVLACKMNGDDEAKTIVNDIDAKLPSV
ncbi:sensor domain-containing protein [Mycobacterium sp. pUA109]|uniref:sensor domain-containing protein n=1 Tax=Mycobacterium sp. pUA109 TaxID=3238982 RepID=UPI00351B36C6